MVSNNAIQGLMPEGIVELEQLEVLDLSRNLCFGPLPENFTDLSNLVIMDLSDNFFGGFIPSDIGQMARLEEIRLNGNFDDTNDFFGFGGPIPISLALLDELRVLQFEENRLTGVLPSQLGYSDDLTTFDVSYNPGLGGNVPEEYGLWQSMESFSISGTSIEGEVPASVCDLEIFIEITCANTELTCTCCTCEDGDGN